MTYRPTRKFLKLPTTIMANGQSNMAAIPTITVGYSSITGLLGSDLEGFYETAQDFTQLVDGSASSLANTNDVGTGVGPGGGQILTRLMRKLADATGETIRSYALAYTSQDISYFLPSSIANAFFENGSQHGSLNNYDLLESYVVASGEIPELYILCQGEADAGRSQSDYYNDLLTLFNATRTDYPGIKWLIIGTIGDAQFRLGGNTAVDAVFRAQKQLSENFPNDVIFIDNSDMSLSTAYYDGVHYTDYIGYEAVADRCFAALIGSTWDPVDQISHIEDVFTWDDVYLYRKSITSGNVSGWQGNTTTLSPVTNSPLNVASSELFGGRSTVELDPSNGETLRLTGLTPADDWTIFGVGLLSNLGASKYAFVIQTPSSSDRVGLVGVGGSNVPTLFEGGSASSFTPAPYANDTTKVHSYCLTIDTTNTLATLYIDGAIFGSRVLTGSETGMTDFWLGSLSGTGIWDGQWACVARRSGDIASAIEVAAMHRWAQKEFKLLV